MTDFDHRYPGLAHEPEPLPPRQTVKCPWCGTLKELDPQVLAKLNPKYVAQTETLKCEKCGTQLIMQARPRGSSEA